ncbi:MAG: murein biosynthesis integral membrane protein MurJ [bacterium]
MENPSFSKITSSATIVSIAVLFSRVMGLIREATLAHLFEAKLSLDAFYAGYRIPNLFRDLFAEGDLSKAFIAIFTDVETKSGEKTAWCLASLVFNSLTIILLIISFLGIIFAPFIIDLFFMGKGFDTPLPLESSYGFANKRELTVYLTRIMFPFLLLVSLSAISMGLLNTKGRFAVPAFAPSLFNIGSVLLAILGYYFAPRIGQHPVVGAALGVIFGGALQFVIQIPSMYRVGFRYKLVLNFTDPDLKRILRLIAPAILSSAAMQISVFINSYFASQFDGWLSWITIAFRVMYLVVGVIGVAFSTATLPVLSRFISEGSIDKFRDTFSYAIKMIFILIIPASAGLIALSKPIISLIFRHGVFSEYDTQQSAGALICYAFGLCGYSGFKIARDGFYAIKDIKTPVIISLFTVGLNALFNYVLIFKLGLDHRSLAVSTSCSITLNFILVLFFLWRRIKNFDGHGIFIAFVKSLIASVVMGILAHYLYRFFSFLGGNISLFISICLSLAFLYFSYHLLKVDEFKQMVRVITRKVMR